MHVVTFYSFKGGVGRTLALANAAAELAKRNRTVLVVDFDLEAPGVSNLPALSPPASAPGVVDFVHEYMRTGIAPDASAYMVRRDFGDGSAPVWVMPAGQQDSRYAAKLNSLDWLRLYREMDGFLLMEDLKAQWVRIAQPDYVLIDSRTGHTDVGGICTRQLPDAVVAMLFPNQQNIAGLADVVASIRNEAAGPRQKQITLHFACSNVPNLDDEEGILSGWIDRARDQLHFDSKPVVIHHYSSLSLLNQSLFVLDRPRSQLSSEYRELVDRVVGANLEDRDGALSMLASIDKMLRRPVEARARMEDFGKKLGLIAEKHERDDQILLRVAQMQERLGEPPETLLPLLTRAIEAGGTEPTLFRLRAQAYTAFGNHDAAIGDLQRLLRSSRASFYDVVTALRSLGEQDSDPGSVVRSVAVTQLDARLRINLANEVMVSRKLLRLSEVLMRDMLKEGGQPADVEDGARTALMLALIGQSKFAEALKIVGSRREAVLSLSIQDAFNCGMAEWGLLGKPPLDLFERVLKIADVESRNLNGSNAQQCLALCARLVGDRKRAAVHVAGARGALSAVPSREFSAWRYLRVTRREFEEDLDEMERRADLWPAILRLAIEQQLDLPVK